MKKKLLIVLSIILIIVGIGVFKFKDIMSFVNESFIKKQVKLQYDEEKITSSKNKPNIGQFRINLDKMDNSKYQNIDKLVGNATIKDIQKLYDSNKLTCEELVTYYLKRIEKYDINKLNSIIELNPDAIKIAKQKDAEGKKGKLYGIPIILKDNIGTGDKMHTTAGAYALKDSTLDKDSFVASKLKKEGAIILAKANLSEWANYMTSNSANGYSALGGQTHNPYGKYDVGGSSSGSGASVAANFAPVAIGSETSGSMIYPSSQNSVVGIKPSLGLVSRNRIIPITEAQDTAGVMAKNVDDAALVLEAIAGYDPEDAETKEAEKHKEVYTKYLQASSIKDSKAVIVERSILRKEEKEVLQKVEEELKKMGVKVSRISQSDDKINNEAKQIDMTTALRAGFKHDLNNYLKIAKVKGINNLNDIVEFNKKDLDNRAPYGQDLLEKSAEDKTSIEEWKKIVANNRKAGARAIDNVLKDADVIVSLSNHTSGIYAPAGYPAVNVPAGYKTTGEPIGVTFVGSKFEEGKLIKIANVYEQNTKHRKAPKLK